MTLTSSPNSASLSPSSGPRVVPYSPRLTPLVMPSDSRGLLVGASGSGKSYLARYLLKPHRSPVIIDPKGDFEPFQDAVIFRSPESFLEKWERTPEDHAILYRPDPEFDDVDDYDKVFKAVFFAAKEGRRRALTYVDEVTLVAPGALRYGRYFRALYNQGRGLGAGMLAVTQRPSSVPGFIISEAIRVWMFRLNLQDDVKRMVQIMGPEVTKRLPEHGFWYRDVVKDSRAYPYLLEQRRAA